MSNKPKINRAGDISKVSQMDICQTPPHALEPLYEYIPKDVYIWESAVGPERLIQKTLIANGYDFVIGTDLMYGDKYNFFTYDPATDPAQHGPYDDNFDWDIQITNMPFSIKYKWLKRSFEFGKRFALLAPYETTFAKDFQELVHTYNARPWYIEILSPERRINYKMPNMGWGITEYDESKGKMVRRGDSAQMPTVWITWGLDVYNKRSDFLRTYYVPMRSVKYNDDNTERL